MKKKKVRQQITDYTLEWYGQIEIEALKKDIAELEKRGALTVDIESDAYVYTTAFFYRDETDMMNKKGTEKNKINDSKISTTKNIMDFIQVRPVPQFDSSHSKALAEFAILNVCYVFKSIKLA